MSTALSSPVVKKTATWVSVPKAAEIAKVSRTTMWRWADTGKIRARRIVGVVRVWAAAARKVKAAK